MKKPRKPRQTYYQKKMNPPKPIFKKNPQSLPSNPNARLSELEVIQVINSYHSSNSEHKAYEIAEHMGVTEELIEYIVTSAQWEYLKPKNIFKKDEKSCSKVPSLTRSL